MDKKLNVIYEDNHVIVVVKPANILSQADITGDIDMLTIIKKYIKEKYNKPGNVYLGLVHRLDRPTSGLMVFAKTSKAAKRLSEDIKKHNFNKIYTLVVNGIMDNKKGTMIDYLEKKDNYNTIISTQEKGKIAELEYEVLKENKEKDLSLVQVLLKTGRHHQIRVQFSSRGHCLYGDNRYGKSDGKQLCLIATTLEFYHPVTKELLKFNIDYDRKMNGFDIF